MEYLVVIVTILMVLLIEIQFLGWGGLLLLFLLFFFFILYGKGFLILGWFILQPLTVVVGSL